MTTWLLTYFDSSLQVLFYVDEHTLVPTTGRLGDKSGVPNNKFEKKYPKMSQTAFFRFGTFWVLFWNPHDETELFLNFSKLGISNSYFPDRRIWDFSRTLNFRNSRSGFPGIHLINVRRAPLRDARIGCGHGRRWGAEVHLAVTGKRLPASGEGGKDGLQLVRPPSGQSRACSAGCAYCAAAIAARRAHCRTSLPRACRRSAPGLVPRESAQRWSNASTNIKDLRT